MTGATTVTDKAAGARQAAPAIHSVALARIGDDKAAVDDALRALWPRLRRDRHGPLCIALSGLLDALATLEHCRLAIEQELTG